MMNVLVVGPVASGKSSLAEDLSRTTGLRVLDLGTVFRAMTYSVLERDARLFEEWETHRGDCAHPTVSRAVAAIGKAPLSFDGQSIVRGGIPLPPESLDSPAVNQWVSRLAGIQAIRKIAWSIAQDYAKKSGSLLLCGHNTFETDLTDFRVVGLDVSDVVAAERFGKRTGAGRDALCVLRERNALDRVHKTKRILGDVFGVTRIATDSLAREDVARVALRELASRAETDLASWRSYRAAQLPRDGFEWGTNPYLEAVRGAIIERAGGAPAWIHRAQVRMSKYSSEELFGISERTAKEVSDLLGARDFSGALRAFGDAARDLSGAALSDECARAADEVGAFGGLREYRSHLPPGRHDCVIRRSAYSENGRFRKKEVKDAVAGLGVVFRELEGGTSAALQAERHYLHTPRDDEYAAFGAFVEGADAPFAFVSFSRHDREYKKSVIDYFGVEPHNTLEMTRAWACAGVPKNAMGALFDFSFGELRSEWERLRRTGDRDKPLAAVTTTINPNLGFSGAAFKGANFLPFALRPAQFEYCDDPRYGFVPTTRRHRVPGVRRYAGALPQIPLNELIAPFSEAVRSKVLAKGVVPMDPVEYHSISHAHPHRDEESGKI